MSSICLELNPDYQSDHVSRALTKQHLYTSMILGPLFFFFEFNEIPFVSLLWMVMVHVDYIVVGRILYLECMSACMCATKKVTKGVRLVRLVRLGLSSKIQPKVLPKAQRSAQRPSL